MFKLLSNDKLEMVQFENGKYGVRVNTEVFLDLDYFMSQQFKWQAGDVYFKSCQGCYLRARWVFNKYMKDYYKRWVKVKQ